jgi:succinate dehydrogenase / fumarate reductase membrane anchor subunit
MQGVTRRKVAVPGNKERSAFMFMRMTGLLLLFLAVGHMMLQHIINDVHDLELAFVIEQWSSWGQRIIDLLLLVFALSHGMNGLRNVLGDYIHKPGTMKAVSTALAAFLIITLIVAGLAIITF